MSTDRIDFDTLPWESTVPGARCTVYREGGKQIRLLEFSEEFVEPHWCEKGHIGYVLEGTLAVDHQGRRVCHPAGSGLFIPGGPQSGHKATSLMPLVRLVLVEDA